MPARCLLLCIAIATAGCAPAGLEDPAARPPTLTVYSGGHVRKALEQIARRFEPQAGCAVVYRTGGSGKMLAEATEAGGSDVYVAADLRALRAAERKNVVAAKIPIAFLRLAIVVAKGNPKHIRALEDLASPGVRVFLEHPTKGCQVGAATADLLVRNHLALTPSAATLDGEPPTLRTVAEFIEAGRLDAAIMWDSMAAQRAGRLETVAIEPARNVNVNIVAIQFRSSARPDLAERFLLFLRSPAARAVLEREGFRTRRN